MSFILSKFSPGHPSLSYHFSDHHGKYSTDDMLTRPRWIGILNVLVKQTCARIEKLKKKKLGIFHCHLSEVSKF